MHLKNTNLKDLQSTCLAVLLHAKDIFSVGIYFSFYSYFKCTSYRWIFIKYICTVDYLLYCTVIYIILYFLLWHPSFPTMDIKKECVYIYIYIYIYIYWIVRYNTVITHAPPPFDLNLCGWFQGSRWPPPYCVSCWQPARCCWLPLTLSARSPPMGPYLWSCGTEWVGFWDAGQSDIWSHCTLLLFLKWMLNVALWHESTETYSIQNVTVSKVIHCLWYSIQKWIPQFKSGYNLFNYNHKASKMTEED